QRDSLAGTAAGTLSPRRAVHRREQQDNTVFLRTAPRESRLAIHARASMATGVRERLLDYALGQSAELQTTHRHRPSRQTVPRHRGADALGTDRSDDLARPGAGEHQHARAVAGVG